MGAPLNDPPCTTETPPFKDPLCEEEDAVNNEVNNPKVVKNEVNKIVENDVNNPKVKSHVVDTPFPNAV